MSMMFLDIATIPDFELGAKLYGLHDLSDKDIARVMFTKSRELESSATVLPQHMHRVLAVSVLFHDKKSIKIWSLGGCDSNESDLLRILERYADEYKSAVVTWNGASSIFPILNYRYLRQAIPMPLFASHTNLMTEMSPVSNAAPVSLHEIAVLTDAFSRKNLSNEEVLNHHLEGHIETVRNNLELNLVNLWMIYQRWQLVNGNIDEADIDADMQLLTKMLAEEGKTHLTNADDELK